MGEDEVSEKTTERTRFEGIGRKMCDTDRVTEYLSRAGGRFGGGTASDEARERWGRNTAGGKSDRWDSHDI